MLLKQTKIVASISDRRCDVDFIKQLFEAGMNVVRMNSAHLQEEGFQKIIDNVRAVSNKIAILMDTKGPEVRTTALSGDSNILFSTGDIVRITGKEGTLTGNGYIGVSYPRFAEDLSIYLSMTESSNLSCEKKRTTICCANHSTTENWVHAKA